MIRMCPLSRCKGSLNNNRVRLYVLWRQATGCRGLFVADTNTITPNQQRRRPNWAQPMRGRAFLTACANTLPSPQSGLRSHPLPRHVSVPIRDEIPSACYYFITLFLYKYLIGICLFVCLTKQL